MPAGLRLLFALLADKSGGAGRQGDHFGFIHPEDQLAKQRRGGIVEVDGGLAGATQCLKGAQDQRIPRLGQHLDGDIFRDALLVDQLADEVEIGLRSGREGDLNLFKTALQQQIPELQFAGAVHGLRQRLVAVAQVSRQPARGVTDLPVWPAAVRQGDRRIGTVLFSRMAQHSVLLNGQPLSCPSTGWRAFANETETSENWTI